jgi:hypothetical protein
LLSIKLENEILFFSWRLSFQNLVVTLLILHPSPVISQFPPSVLSLRVSHIAILIDFSELNWDYTTFYHQFLAVPFFHLPNASTPFLHLPSPPLDVHHQKSGKACWGHESHSIYKLVPLWRGCLYKDEGPSGNACWGLEPHIVYEFFVGKIGEKVRR